MYGINMYRPSLWGIDSIKSVMYHEMSHALAFQSINWKNGEKINVGTLPKSLQDTWETARQKDYEYRKKNNISQQDTSEYGETNSSEDWAEMGSVISCKITKSDYTLDSAYKVYEEDPTRASGRRFSHRQTVDEIIENNPNRAKLMMDLMKDSSRVDTQNKREYINNIEKEFAERFDEEYVETW